MCVQTVCVHWPDNLFPCCCDEEAVLCPDNVYILPSLAAQLNLSWNMNMFTNQAEFKTSHWKTYIWIYSIGENKAHPNSQRAVTL